MPALNHVVLLGNLTREPELRYTPNGTAVCDLGLAVNRRYTTNNGEKREDVLFITCVAWGKTAENCAEHLEKGSLVAVEGRLQSRTWEDKQGQKRTSIEVVAEQVQFLSFRDGGRDSGRRPQSPQPARTPDDGDSVPF